jgi:hypothetical protein
MAKPYSETISLSRVNQKNDLTDYECAYDLAVASQNQEVLNALSLSYEPRENKKN